MLGGLNAESRLRLSAGDPSSRLDASLDLIRGLAASRGLQEQRKT